MAATTAWGGAMASAMTDGAKRYTAAAEQLMATSGPKILTETQKFELFAAEQGKAFRDAAHTAMGWANGAREAGKTGIAQIMESYAAKSMEKADQALNSMIDKKVWLDGVVKEANATIEASEKIIARVGGGVAKLAGPIVDGAQMIAGAWEYSKTGDSKSWENACGGLVMGLVGGVIAGGAVVLGAAALTVAAPVALTAAATAIGAGIGSFFGGQYFTDWRDAMLSSNWFINLIDGNIQGANTEGDPSTGMPWPNINLITALQTQFAIAEQAASPLILDLDGQNGAETIGQSAGVHFDHDGNKFAELTGWVGKNDGLLVWDKNNNNQIDNGAELFGNNTVLSNGRKAAHGFAALRELDANKDSKVDASDAAFSQLRVFKDVNGNGVADAGELLTLGEAGVRSLNTRYTNQTVTDANGNQHLQVGSFTTTSGQNRAMDDVWFAMDAARTIDTDLVAVNSAIAALPDLAGFGNVHSLHQAMARDSTGKLQGLVQGFQNSTDATARAGLFDQILWAWTGADRYLPTSRGANMDARKLYTVEAFMGRGFLQNEAFSIPGFNASAQLVQTYALLSESLYGQLAGQTLYKPLYESIALKWDAVTQMLALDVSAVVTLLKTRYDANPAQGQAMIAGFADNLGTLGETGALIAAKLQQQGRIQGQGFDLYLATMGGSLLNGTAGVDTLNAKAGVNNFFIAGRGADILKGSDGADTFRWSRGDGNDIIKEAENVQTRKDSLQLLDVNASDVRLSRDVDNLYVTIGTERIKVANHFGVVFTTLEQIQFSDGSIWQKSVLDAAPFRGTNGADTLNGTAGGEVLIGGKGADTISGGDGSDIYQWTKGDGNDILADFDWQAADDIDTLKLVDVAAGGVSLSRDASHLYITVTATGEKIQISKHFEDAVYNLERIEFASGNPLLLADLNAAPFRGTNAADTLNGTAGGELLIGGKGADTISGGAGNDTFQWSRGDGNDVISANDWQAGDVDTLKLVDVAAAGVSLGRDFANLYITVIATGEKLQISDHFTSAAYNLERIEFASGNPLLLAALNAAPFRGTNAADTLSGSAGGGLFIGGRGADTISSGAGNDTFQWSKGDGNDVISDCDWKAGNIDTLKFTDVASGGVSLCRDASHLYITVTATGEKIQISNHFEDAAYKLERIEFASGNPLLLAALNAAPFRGTDAADTLNGTAGSELLIGGKGADTISGGTGNDTFQWSRGDGNDVISDYDSWNRWTGSIDTLKFTDVAAGGVSLSRDASHLYITVTATGEKIQISKHFEDAAYNLERIEFASGNPLLLADLNAAPFRGTDAADKLDGTDAGDVFIGGKGADAIAGGGGNDVYQWKKGDGNDILTEFDWQAGNVDTLRLVDVAAGGVSLSRDNANLFITVTATGEKIQISKHFIVGACNLERIEFASGNPLLLADFNAAPFRGTAGADTIVGSGGNDVFDGLAGNDFLAGGAGSDTYRIGRGYGADTLQDIDFTAGNKDVLQFLGGISSKQLWFRHTGNDLDVSIIGTADKATVQYWYLGSFFHIEQIQAGDGKVLLDTQVETLVQAMAGLAPPALGQMDLSAAYAAQLAPVLGANWH